MSASTYGIWHMSDPMTYKVPPEWGGDVFEESFLYACPLQGCRTVTQGWLQGLVDHFGVMHPDCDSLGLEEITQSALDALGTPLRPLREVQVPEEPARPARGRPRRRIADPGPGQLSLFDQ